MVWGPRHVGKYMICNLLYMMENSYRIIIKKYNIMTSHINAY
jgi:hypothetical protein